jgi:putative ABC transport system permease protein
MPSIALKLSWRMLLRDWRAGELRVLALALIVAVGSVTTVGFFTDRMQRALRSQANLLLAADLVLASDQPPQPSFGAEATRRGLQVAQTAAFPSMVVRGERSQLAEIKAVSAGYPLRGEARIATQPFAADRVASGIPESGTVWLDERLYNQLGTRIGERIELGAMTLTVAAVLAREPDRMGSIFSIAPRLLMNQTDLERTGLIRTGSRVSYRLLLAGDEKTVAVFRSWAQPRLGRGQSLEGVQDARPEVRAALERAQQYLGLAALLSVVLAAVAVALAARRFMQRHLDSCAVMRCLGARQSLLLWLFLLQFVWLGLIASLLGCVLGFFAQELLAQWLAVLVANALPSASWLQALQGMLVGMALLLGFSLPPLLALRQVPTLRVLRRELGAPRGFSLAGYVLGFGVLAALLLWKAGDLRLGLYALGGLVATLLVAGGFAWGLIFAVTGVQGHFASPWRYGLANIRRRAGGSMVQVVAFALGILALLLLTLVRGDLLESWRTTLPQNAPNRFVINIQPDQVAPLQAFFAQQQIAAPVIFPMIKGRLMAVNGRPISPADYPEEQAKRMVEREFNLSWSSTLPANNTLVGGRWWGEAERGALLSVEQGIAKTLRVRLGDRLTYNVAGAEFTGTVANLRKVEWDSFRVNFFVIGPPGLLRDYPTSYITSFYLPEAKSGTLNVMVKAFPNLTVIDVAAIMAQVRAIMDRVAGAVEFVFLFTLGSGLMVLYAAIAATRDERLYEAAILRTLGASRRQILLSQFAEFAGIGLLAGLIAAGGASAMGYVLSSQVFHLHYGLNPWVWVAGVGMGGLGVALAGLLGTRSILGQPPLRIIRETA